MSKSPDVTAPPRHAGARSRKSPLAAGLLAPLQQKTPRRLLVAGVCIAVIYWAVSEYTRSTAETFAVQRGKAISAVYGTVKIDWVSSANIRAQNTGYIHFAEIANHGQASIGMKVHKGDVLGNIFDEATSQQIHQATIDLQAALDRQALGPPSAEALRTAEDTLSRYEKLHQVDNVPLAQLEQARNQVKLLETQVHNEKIDIDHGLDSARQNLHNLEDRMSKTQIKSPIDGVLTTIANVDGELVFENNTVFTVAVDSTYVEGQVNEEDVGSLKPGMKAKVRLYSFPNQELTARVSSILPAGDPVTQRYTVILNIENSPPNLMAGMTGEMNIILGEREGALLIPARALIEDRVLLVENGIVKPRLVKVGFRSLEEVEILKGLQEGELVIVADHDLFRSGQRVRPIQVNLERASASASDSKKKRH